MGAGRKFLLILWKNWLLQKRKKALTFFEIFLPVFITLILFGIRQINSISYKNSGPHTWNNFTVEQLQENLTAPNNAQWMVAFSPNNALTSRIMQEVSTQLNVTLLRKYMYIHTLLSISIVHVPGIIYTYNVLL